MEVTGTQSAQNAEIQTANNVTFDDFERMDYGKKEEPAKESKGSEEVKQSVGEQGKEKQASDDGEAGKDTGKKEESKEQVKQLKMLKAMLEDKGYEIPYDAQIPVKVNGKVENVSVQELMNQYSGKTDWTKKYTEFDKERRTFSGEKEKVVSLVNKFNDLAKGEDPLAPLTFLVDTGKGDSYAYIERLRNYFGKQFEEMNGLNEDQRQAYLYKQKLEFLENQRNSEKAREAENLTKNEQNAKLEKALSESKIDKEEFESTYFRLKQETGKDWKPEQVLEYMTKYVPAAQTELNVLNALSDKIVVTQELKDQIHGIALENPDFTSEDIVEIVEEYYKSVKKQKAEKTLAEKVELPKSASSKQKEEFESFDDFASYRR